MTALNLVIRTATKEIHKTDSFSVQKFAFSQVNRSVLTNASVFTRFESHAALHLRYVELLFSNE